MPKGLSKEATARKQERRAIREKVQRLRKAIVAGRAMTDLAVCDAVLAFTATRTPRVNEPRHKGGAGK